MNKENLKLLHQESNDVSGVSAVIACHNSSRVIGATIEALLNQKIDESIQLEIIVADNNCSDDTVDIVNNIYKNYKGEKTLKIIHESEPGAAYARRSAVYEASCSYVSFVDDDNILQEDWIQKVFDIFSTKLDVGVIGGLNEAYIDGDKPDWFDTFQGSFACGPQAEESGYITDRMFVFGAGASFRKQILWDIYHSSLPLFLTGKKTGAFMFSGNDSELCHRAVLMGWEIWYDESIVLKHNLDAKRLKWQGLCNTQAAHSAALIILEIYRDLIHRRRTKGYLRLLKSKMDGYYRFYRTQYRRGRLGDLKIEGLRPAVGRYHHKGMVKAALMFWKKYNPIREQIFQYYKDKNFSSLHKHADIKKGSQKYLNAFLKIDKETYDKIINTTDIAASLPVDADFGDHYRLVNIAAGKPEKFSRVLHLYFLWESLQEQEMIHSAAVTFSDGGADDAFWIRLDLGEKGDTIEKGEYIAGIVRTTTAKLKNLKGGQLGVRVVIPGKNGVSVNKEPSDTNHTRLLLPLDKLLQKNTVATDIRQTPPKIFEEKDIVEPQSPDNPSGSKKYVLFTTLYNERDPSRIKEYLECIEKNLSHPLIHRLHIFYDTLKDEGGSEILDYLKKNKNITKVYIEGRPSYEELFIYANTHVPDSRVIICNADVYFNDTLDALTPVDLGDKFLALSRWNIGSKGELELIQDKHGRPNYLSEDAWIFQTPLTIDFICDYQLGTFFCDSFMNTQLFSSQLKLYNPCLDVQVVHLHEGWGTESMVKSEDDLIRIRMKKKIWHQEQKRLGYCPGTGVYWCTVNDMDKPPQKPYYWKEP